MDITPQSVQLLTLCLVCLFFHFIQVCWPCYVCSDIKPSTAFFWPIKHRDKCNISYVTFFTRNSHVRFSDVSEHLWNWSHERIVILIILIIDLWRIPYSIAASFILLRCTKGVYDSVVTPIIAARRVTIISNVDDSRNLNIHLFYVVYEAIMVKCVIWVVQ